jgi:hypothetical protein
MEGERRRPEEETTKCRGEVATGLGVWRRARRGTAGAAAVQQESARREGVWGDG